ncbi:MAG: hypothetical protein P8L23_05340 [Flavobacteriales bacterium]|nr:hypothetical protein [Flavobacteriales bacterium]
MIRLISTFLIFVFLNIASFAQSKSGKIEFKIEYELIEELESQRSTLSNKMIIYMNDGFSRKEEVTRIGSQVLINDIKNNQSFLLMQIAEEKLAIQVQEPCDSNEIKEKITYLDQTKEIAGYSCKKAVLNTYENKKEEANTIEFFYTNEISGVYDLKFKNIKGTPLEFTVRSKGMTITYTATVISIAQQNDDLFEIPEDFTILSMSEFKRLMSN